MQPRAERSKQSKQNKSKSTPSPFLSINSTQPLIILFTVIFITLNPLYILQILYIRLLGSIFNRLPVKMVGTSLKTPLDTKGTFRFCPFVVPRDAMLYAYVRILIVNGDEMMDNEQWTMDNLYAVFVSRPWKSSHELCLVYATVLAGNVE